MHNLTTNFRSGEKIGVDFIFEERSLVILLGGEWAISSQAVQYIQYVSHFTFYYILGYQVSSLFNWFNKSGRLVGKPWIERERERRGWGDGRELSWNCTILGPSPLLSPSLSLSFLGVIALAWIISSSSLLLFGHLDAREGFEVFIGHKRPQIRPTRDSQTLYGRSPSFLGSCTCFVFVFLFLAERKEGGEKTYFLLWRLIFLLSGYRYTYIFTILYKVENKLNPP